MSKRATCTMPSCNHPVDKVAFHPSHKECRYCGAKWVVPLTVADALTVPEVRVLADYVHRSSGYTHPDNCGCNRCLVLAPFLAAMEEKR